MRFGAAIGPVKHNIGGGHYLYRMGINIYRVLTRVERLVNGPQFLTRSDV